MRSPAEAAPGFVHVPELDVAVPRLTLSAEESHYVARVCRARAGDPLTGSDGRGRIAKLVVLDVAPAVIVRVESVETVVRTRRAHLLTGAPEGQRADWMVEKLAELGIGRWSPVECERAGWGRAAGRSERWRRLAVAALKQSRSAFLLEIDDPATLVAALRGIEAGAERWLADATGGTAAGPAAAVTAVAIGPSPGFSPTERKLLGEEGFRPVRLAENRLRTETAAVAWAGWWSASGTGS